MTRRSAPFVLLVLGLPAAAFGQADRLQALDPSIALRTGGRTGECDGIRFSPDGKELLAVGDDKVVSRWRVGADRLTPLEPFHWNTFREVRGSIYALALDPAGGRVAVAGAGRLNADVSVFDRATGTIVAAMSSVLQPKGQPYTAARSAVWSLAYDRFGRRLAIGQDDGSVYVWDTAAPAGTGVALVAPAVGSATLATRAVWVGFAPDGHVRFARGDGSVFEGGTGSASRKLFALGQVIRGAVETPDHAWLIARPAEEKRTPAAGGKATFTSTVFVHSLTGGANRSIVLADGVVPEEVAVDATGQFLAVGYRVKPDNLAFQYESAGQIRLYDLTQTPVREVAKTKFANRAGRSFPPQAIAFDPKDNTRLAVAGGPNHEVSLLKVSGDKFVRLDEAVGNGRCLWEVRANADGTVLAFRDDPAATPASPNARGAGDWRTFDLTARKWRKTPPAGLEGPRDTANGWTVRMDKQDIGKWSVVKDQFDYDLDLDRARDGLPTCYTFLPPKAGSRAARVAVGHLWGFSIFEVEENQNAVRVYRGTGHAGPVTSIVTAKNGEVLVTASRDQTIALWSINPWKLEGWKVDPLCGAEFGVVGQEMTVAAVAPGSPVWEAGLLARDRITEVFYDNKKIANPVLWEQAVKNAVPGKELAFRFLRGNDETVREAKTTLLQRPQWKFFPTADNEWVLYRYQDYIYDCSTNGDSFIGWRVGGATAADTPDFERADQFRKQFYQPKLVSDYLAKFDREPGKAMELAVLPPKVDVTVKPDPADPKWVIVTVTATPRKSSEIFVRNTGALPPNRVEANVFPLEKVELWLGDADNADYELKSWVPKTVAERTQPFTQVFRMQTEQLRFGLNRVSAVAYAGTRGEAHFDFPNTAKTERKFGTLWALVVGVNTYDHKQFPNLDAAEPDAKRVNETLTKLAEDKTRQSFITHKITPLSGATAKQQDILRELRRIASQAGPDDWIVVFLAGHGDGEKNAAGAVLPGTWYYAAQPDNGNAKPEEFAVSGTKIFETLKAANCRKMVLLDTCHSGAATADAGRDIRTDGKGPVVLSAAAANEKAYELDADPRVTGSKPFGFFTNGLTAGLDDKRDEADRNRDGVLTVGELHAFVRQRVSDLVKANPNDDSAPQTVVVSPNPLFGVPVATTTPATLKTTEKK